MYKLKEYPKDFKDSTGKNWLRFKRKIKKIAHTRLRRGAVKHKYDGKEIAW